MKRAARALLSALLLLGGCSLSLDFEDECQTDEDCLAHGWARYCKSKLCVASEMSELIDTVHCQRVYPEGFDRSQGILLGTLLPSTGALENFGPPMEEAVYLAIDEINQAGGIAGRKLGVLSCDSGTDPDTAAAAARHLAEVARVPAVIGPASSGIATHAFTEVFHDAGVLLISPSATAPSITNLPDNGLFWRTAPTDAFQGAAIAAHLQASAFERIAVINRDDAYGNGLKNVIESMYCVDQLTCEDTRYLARTYRIDSDTAIGTDQAKIITELTQFNPSVIVLIGLLEDGFNFLNILEEDVLTQFIVSDGLKDPKLFELNNDNIKDRLLGTAPASPAGDNYQQFVLRYKSKYSGKTPNIFTPQSYDALYVLAYAVGAHPSGQRPTGASIAANLKRLTGGERFNVGENSFNTVLEILRSGATSRVNIDGASGPLDFDPETGEAPSDIEAWRLDTTEQKIVSLGILYSAEGEHFNLNAPLPNPDAGLEDATPSAPDAGLADAAAPDA
ncbi:ABC transporter substrate-binding protein [Myxococcota bacterium]|nr:ABC transporter substrate-binding protein [Myxococcota bacterium]MBU1900164.1 ABC transporter substrate-binding protein [Myxococcota bacterium]